MNDDLILAVSLAAVGLSSLALWLLARPASWLSRWIDSRETVGGTR
jgi:hypothetical protein